ncbi:MAG: type I-E CRISPR-associated protein Cas5/CasD [Paracoccus sp. (in: a-proteobacteria)]|uniref:type I-E CRISPR-associated protein Cas5/CasD n=1 Tax=Paracoccus sp. TaxID=267 RepID=UPI00405960E7
MTEHLVFTLCAAMGAMGDLAGHERRGSMTWPGRSALIGLVAAAMGIRRGDAERFAALDGLRIAVGVIEDGVPLRDYHTVETVPTAAARNPDSRPGAIASAGRRTNTTITLRDYRVGVAYAVAMWAGPVTLSLVAMRDALERPTFTLYLGRKSCPLAAPPAARIVQADGPLAALEQAARPPFGYRGGLRLIASDWAIGPDDQVEGRNDLPVDRVRWHFAQRPVHLHRPAGQGGA